MGPLNMLYHIELFEYTLIRILFIIYPTFGIQRIENHRFSLPTSSWVYRFAFPSDFELILSIKLNYPPPYPPTPTSPACLSTRFTLLLELEWQSPVILKNLNTKFYYQLKWLNLTIVTGKVWPYSKLTRRYEI